MPIGKLVKCGVWENGSFRGVVIFSTGASPQLHKAFDLNRFQVCELVRVALSKHVTPVSRIVRIALKMLKTCSPKLRLVVSFADPEQGHHGGIYQAGNWVYIGRSSPGIYYRLRNSKLTHNRNLQGPKGFGGKPRDGVQKQWTDQLRRDLASGAISVVKTQPKHKYLMPLDTETKTRIEKLRKPYPKASEATPADAPVVQTGEGGSTPTRTLH